MSKIRLLVATIALLVFGEVLAQTVYRWVDDHGEVHYGHAVPPEFTHRGYERLGRDGVVRERVEPALAPEQLAERRAQQQREAELAAQQRNQESSDRLLLATYRSENDLRASLEMQLTALNSQRASIRMALNLVEGRFESLVSRAAEHTRNSQAVPAALESSIDEARAELRRLRTDLTALDGREQDLRDQFASDLNRYRELTSRHESG